MELAHNRPRFRTDLVAQPFEEGGQLVVEVTDPESGASFRFYETEYYVASAMDGTLDVDGLQRWSSEELGLEPPAEEIQTLIRTLADLGYLSESPPLPADVELGLAGATASARTGPPIAPAKVELGHAGRSEMTPPRPGIPKAAEVELGLAGSASAPSADEMSFAGLLDEEPRPEQGTPRHGDFGLDGLTPPPPQMPTASLTPRGRADSDDDGPTNLPPAVPIGQEPDEEVSVDLSAHLDLGVEDVKEAVRASQVMAAVQVPRELADEIGDGSPPVPPDVAPAPLPTQPRMGSQPMELPKERVGMSKPRTKPVGPASDRIPEPLPQRSQKSGNLLTIVLVIILIGALGGAGYYYYAEVLNKDEDSAKKPEKPPTTEPQPKGTKTTPPPTKASPPTAKLVKVAGKSSEVKATRAGVIEWIAGEAKVEKEGVLIKLKGAEKYLQRAEAAVKRKQSHYQPRYDKTKKLLEQAKKAGEKAKIRRFTAKLAENQADLDRKDREAKGFRDRAAEYMIKSPMAGTFEPEVKKGQWIGKDKVAGTVSAGDTFSATFTVKGNEHAAGDKVTVHTEADAAKKAECSVTEVVNEKVTITCPAGDPLADGAAVVLE